MIFSTLPGTTVPTAPHPNEPQESIGPLGRRFLLAVQRYGPEAVTVATLTAAMRDPSFDPATRPGVSYAEPGPAANWRLLPRATSAGGIIKVPPTGSAPDLCCTTTQPPPSTRLRGAMRILAAPPGHWLTSGEPIGLATPGATLRGFVANPGAVTVEAEQGEQRWSITLAAPEGAKLGQGAYERGERATCLQSVDFDPRYVGELLITAQSIVS